LELKPEFLTLRVGSIPKVETEYTIYSNSVPWHFELILKVEIENRKTINLLAINNNNKKNKDINIKFRKYTKYKSSIVNKRNNIYLYYRDKLFCIILIVNNTSYTN